MADSIHIYSRDGKGAKEFKQIEFKDMTKSARQRFVECTKQAEKNGSAVFELYISDLVAKDAWVAALKKELVAHPSYRLIREVIDGKRPVITLDIKGDDTND